MGGWIDWNHGIDWTPRISRPHHSSREITTIVCGAQGQKAERGAPEKGTPLVMVVMTSSHQLGHWLYTR